MSGSKLRGEGVGEWEEMGGERERERDRAEGMDLHEFDLNFGGKNTS